MTRRASLPFSAIRSEGSLLPVDLLSRLVDQKGFEGVEPDTYHLSEGMSLKDAIARSWTHLLGVWRSFARHLDQAASSGDPLVGVTRERWVLPLFQELGYGRLFPAKSVEVNGQSYAISHFWQHVPIHSTGVGVDLDTRTRSVAGAARVSPYGLLQDYLNRASDALWGFVTNGRRLRVLRDNISLTRLSYVEFDLEQIFASELYRDFAALWLLIHQSRVESVPPSNSWLEKWAQESSRLGVRALDQLRDGVQETIETLGAGFMAHPKNGVLREALRQGELTTDDFYRQILRTVYRLLFLFVAEDRDLLAPQSANAESKRRYTTYYSMQRLRKLAQKLRGSRHGDLWKSFVHVVRQIYETGSEGLALPALGGFLWSADAAERLDHSELSNNSFLAAIRHLAFVVDEKTLRPIDYKNLGSEELGSVYESLLELRPRVDLETSRFELKVVSGSERKTTGSYYTPSSLIHCLLDSALDPVLDAAAAKPTPKDAEAAILNLKVCDPACGSGHFLVAAAHRIAKRLAALRSGDEEPSPAHYTRALRDVIGRCIYAVDINPMALELCKVSLWIESMEPGMPLTFLDAHIRCGDALIGTTPYLLAQGLPDEAYDVLDGDDRDVCREFRRRNRDEKSGQLFFSMAAESADLSAEITALAQGVESSPDHTLSEVLKKEEKFDALERSYAMAQSRLLADAWCAAFVQKKDKSSPIPITQSVLNQICDDPNQLDGPSRQMVRDLARQYGFFHWQLAFPEVFRQELSPDQCPGWIGGFDCVLGNPPWERIKLQEQEFFAARKPDIAEAPNKAARTKLIASLKTDDPALYRAWTSAQREAEGRSHFLRHSDRYPLTGRGDINTYAVFAETMKSLIGPKGRVGCIVPTGIATDDTTKLFFQSVVQSFSLERLCDFENRDAIFPSVDRRTKFSLVTLRGTLLDKVPPVFSFFALSTSDLEIQDRQFSLSPADIALINPNTQTCPVFRSRRDAEITKSIYRRVPVLVNESLGDAGNPWSVSFLRMFDMANDSGLFRTRDSLLSAGFTLSGNRFTREAEVFVPLYEAKMVHHFDHRYGDYADQPRGSESTQLPAVPASRLVDPTYAPLPRYWVSAAEVDARLANRWPHDWLLGWRDICRSTDERTVIASVIPRVGVGHTTPLFMPMNGNAEHLACCYANLSALVFDYIARQKIGGTHLTYGFMNQLTLLSPKTYDEACPWIRSMSLASWLVSRVVELTYTAIDVAEFGLSLGFKGQPFIWDAGRRFLLRCELDAAYFHLYGLDRSDTAYILDTFPIVRRHDETTFGTFRTKDKILEIFDVMSTAISSGRPYQTLLDPPPGDDRCRHSTA